MDSIQFGDNYYTVELRGNYESVNFVADLSFTFGDYFITDNMKSYLYLPNGDGIIAKSGKPYYVRQNGVVCNYESISITNWLLFQEINFIYSQQMLKLFGCEGPLPVRELTDVPPNDNPYPYPYFVKN